MKYGYFAAGLFAMCAIAAVAVLGFDVSIVSHGSPVHFAAVAFGAGIADTELKAAFDKIGEAFEAFKGSHDEQLKELKKSGSNDPILIERLEKIEKSLDAGVEAKAAIDVAFAAEKKEREDLEARMNRMGVKATGEDAAKRELELKELNLVLGAHNAERKNTFQPLDEKGVDEYKAAHATYLRKGDRLLSADEMKTLSVGSDPDGGYYVTPDTGGRIVSKVFETSPIRQIAAQQTISTDALEGIEDLDEAGAGYAGEKALSGDTKTPQVGKWRIPVFWIDTEPKTTQQLLDDSAVNIEAWLSGKVADKFGRFESREFVTGATNIRGFTSYPTAVDSGDGVAWGSLGYVKTGVSSDFAASNPADQILDLIGLLKSAYLSNARFVTRRSVVTKIRKFKDGTTNAYLWQPSFVLGDPERIAGYPVTRAEDMPALGAGSLSLAFGDFNQGYQIVDRQGIRVLRDNLTSKPYVKFYTTNRVGGGVLNFEAIKFLKFGTS
jgi:HK97 family phage major capsid protein